MRYCGFCPDNLKCDTCPLISKGGDKSEQVVCADMEREALHPAGNR